MSSLITPAEYLLLRGWTQTPFGGWCDPRPVQHGQPPCELDEAVERQCVRDEQCETFRRSHMARRVLEQCALANAAMATARDGGADEDEVARVGAAIVSGAAAK